MSIMVNKGTNRPQYDLPTAVTFLFAGLTLGWILALLFSPPAEDSMPHRRPVAQPQAVADEVFFD